MIFAFDRKSSRIALAVLAFGMASVAHAGEYEGHWELKDTQGKTFEVSLQKDGTADGTHNESMKHGTWKVEDGAAVIHWNTGWTTRIVRDGQGYSKTAFKPGAALTDKPANHSDAKKIP